MTELQKAWNDWLEGIPFTHFLTLTFGEYSPRPELALKYWKQESEQLRGSFWFAVVENGKLYGRTHLHVLLNSRWPVDVQLFDASWRKRFGFTKITAFRPDGGAVSYCVKYAIKEESALWDIHLPGGSRTPADISPTAALLEPQQVSWYDGQTGEMKPLPG